ncbi:MAG: alpha/beta hydrolase [Clostridia bacterium]|nr:alpha/beta hydrolase [Clostridia bacterium]
MQWIREDNYAKDMHDIAEPYVAERTESGYAERVAGQRIYYEHYHADAPKGVIVISHGFTESVRKFTESVYYMLQAGYEVWGMDHRGHGRSFRENDNPYIIYVRRFEEYIWDLEHLVRTRVIPGSQGLPLYLYSHSMGGCIGAWTIEEYPDLFQKAVLSSPMLGLDFPIPTPLMYAGATLMGIPSQGKNAFKPVNGFEKKPDFIGSCDSSEVRYLYYHGKRVADEKLQMHAASIGWGKEAVKACARVTKEANMEKIRIPVLLMQAGDDRVVRNASQDLFAEKVKTCEKHTIPGMKHELYMTDSEVLIPYWERIFQFFG